MLEIMSRTFRTKPTGRARNIGRHVERVREGHRDTTAEVVRDNRVTGLREHREYRRRTRAMLKHGEYGSVLAGKKRRYGDRYGEYEW